MLDSMINNPIPTRAEATDVANAVWDGTDAIMLSGETTIGKYPVETVTFMHDIAQTTEQARKYDVLLDSKNQYNSASIADTVGFSTCAAALGLKAKAIICPTTSGFTAACVAKYKPEAPIYAFVRDEKVQRKLQVYSGVEALIYEKQEDVEHMIQTCVSRLKEKNQVATGDVVVVTAGLPFSKKGETNMMKVHIVD
jgi:pyruvate kinase